MGRQTVRFRVSRLRRIAARPFGLTIADTAVMLGDESSSTGLIAEIRAAVARAPVRLDSISLLYGDCLDLSAPFVEVSIRTCRTLTRSLTSSRSALAGPASWKTWTGSPARR
jgi:hypothetical protein